MIEIRQVGRGELPIDDAVPIKLQKHIITYSIPRVISGEGFHTIMQEFKGEGFSAFFNQMFAEQRTVIRITADIPVLELRIAIKNQIRGHWDESTEGDLPEHFFHMAFVPMLETEAIFANKAEYQTFDIHLHLSFLQSIGVNYKLLDRFIEKVHKGNEPVELVPTPFACSYEMLQLVQIILSSDKTPQGHAQMLRNHITSIVIAALEIVSKQLGINFSFSKSDKAALEEIRQIIHDSPHHSLTNAELLSKVHPRLNLFKLQIGFKRMFGINTKEYYQQVRFAKAEELLNAGALVDDVYEAVGYQSATAFIAAFKERYGITPKQWTKR